MQGGVFDPATFLAGSVNDANSTQFVPVPEGEYTAIIGAEVVARQWGPNAKGQSGIVVDVPWIVDDERVKEIVGRDQVVVKQGIMLDLGANGSIDTGKGKNVTLGRLREAVGLNKPGEPFSWTMLPGKVARISVKNKEYEGAIFSEVKAVTHA